jgi:hypothetical protein
MNLVANILMIASSSAVPQFTCGFDCSLLKTINVRSFVSNFLSKQQKTSEKVKSIISARTFFARHRQISIPIFICSPNQSSSPQVSPINYAQIQPKGRDQK